MFCLRVVADGHKVAKAAIQAVFLLQLPSMKLPIVGVWRVAVVALLIAGACSTEGEVDPRELDELELGEDYEPLVDGEPAVSEALDFVDGGGASVACPPAGQSPGGWGYCSALCKCGEGQGDCDSEDQCQDGLLCKEDVGADYGWAWNVDVCESACDPIGCGPRCGFVSDGCDGTIWCGVCPPALCIWGECAQSGIYSGNCCTGDHQCPGGWCEPY